MRPPGSFAKLPCGYNRVRHTGLRRGCRSWVQHGVGGRITPTRGRRACTKGTAISQQEAAAGVTANTRGLERQLARHIKKLEDYRTNPEAFDNQGLLRKAPTPEIRQQIIEGRIRKLEGQIRVFQREIEKRRGIT